MSFSEDDDGVTDKDREDERHHYEIMQQQYLVWYQGRLGGMFSIDVGGYLKRARENRDMFIEDGFPARIVKLTVVDGEPVAEWVEGNQP